MHYVFCLSTTARPRTLPLLLRPRSPFPEPTNHREVGGRSPEHVFFRLQKPAEARRRQGGGGAPGDTGVLEHHAGVAATSEADSEAVDLSGQVPHATLRGSLQKAR